MKKLLDVACVAGLTMGIATPAFAGELGVPAPIAGVGAAAAVILGIGYRALRKRIDR